MKTTWTIIALLGVGALGVALGWWLGGNGAPEAAAEREPLYWVAPMDPSYRRDAPGKSPMGMDLVPVYEEDAADADTGVRVSPALAHSFGLRTAEVQRERFVESIRTLGRVALDEDRVSHIHPRVEGWIEELTVDAEGDPVTQGEKLFELYSPTLVKAQEEILIARRSGDAALTRASRERLAALGMTAEQIEALLRRGEAAERVPVYAPQDGFVVDLNVREGMHVEPRTEVLAIGARDPVWVFAEVFERQVPWVAEGQPVTFTLDYLPGREWTGRVDYVYPTLEEGSRTLRLRLRMPNPDLALRPGMFGQVRLNRADVEPTLTVPREAVIRGADSDRVVVAIGDDRYRARRVELGRVGRERIEILEGLEQGETVVTSGQFLIDSESTVETDLARMGALEPETERCVRVTGTFLEQLGPGRIRLRHDAVPEWGWPAMTMDLPLAPDVDVAGLTAGAAVRACIEKMEDGPRILRLAHGGTMGETTPDGTAHDHEAMAASAADDHASAEVSEGMEHGHATGAAGAMQDDDPPETGAAAETEHGGGSAAEEASP